MWSCNVHAFLEKSGRVKKEGKVRKKTPRMFQVVIMCFSPPPSWEMGAPPPKHSWMVVDP